ncbi:uncharacterized protein LOC129587175 isoform X2 [Paramacrobiotus metropolitanus]|nr:uncharacterized protein LOC129587175 isoform X2 [Paramacrobiotus metropolitanus]
MSDKLDTIIPRTRSKSSKPSLNPIAVDVATSRPNSQRDPLEAVIIPLRSKRIAGRSGKPETRAKPEPVRKESEVYTFGEEAGRDIEDAAVPLRQKLSRSAKKKSRPCQFPESGSEEIESPSMKRKKSDGPAAVVVRTLAPKQRSKTGTVDNGEEASCSKSSSGSRGATRTRENSEQKSESEHNQSFTSSIMESAMDDCASVKPVEDCDVILADDDEKEKKKSTASKSILDENQTAHDLSVFETSARQTGYIFKRILSDDSEYVEEDGSASTSEGDLVESSDEAFDKSRTDKRSMRKRKKPERYGISSSGIETRRLRPRKASSSSSSQSGDKQKYNAGKVLKRENMRHRRRSPGLFPVDDDPALKEKGTRKVEKMGRDRKLLRDAEKAGVRHRFGEYNLRSRGSKEKESTPKPEPRKRYGLRANRPPEGALVMPDLSAILHLESEISADEPPRKKRIANRNKDTSDEYSSFEPTLYWPTKEISFDTIGGCAAIKEQLTRELLLPFRKHLLKRQQQQQAVPDEANPESVALPEQTGGASYFCRGVLFWGPPGTGKTFMAKAVAYECGKDITSVPVYVISGAELLTKWVGESENHLRLIFQQAQLNSPSIIFIDELDGLVRRRTTSESDHVNFNMVSTMLTLLNGVIDRGSVIVIATTNYKDVLDPALMRSGRFDLKILFPAPNTEERTLILETLTKDWKVPLTDTDRAAVAVNTEGFTGADLDLLCKKAQNISELAVEQQKESDNNNYNNNELPDTLHIFFKALLEVEPSALAAPTSGGTVSAPLDGRVRPLVEKQLQKLIEELTAYYPVRMPGESMALHSSAMWGTFKNGSLMLDYHPVLFVYTERDPLLLDLVTSALFHQLSMKNQVRSIDFRSTQYTVTVTVDCQTLLSERSCIAGLFHLDEACSMPKNDILTLPTWLVKALSKRNGYRAPLLVVTSSRPPDEYAEKMREIFGDTSLQFRVNQPNLDQLKEFFSDLFDSLHDSDNGISNGAPERSGNGILNGQLKRKRAKLAGYLSSELPKIDDLLSKHQILSRAIWQGRNDPHKADFFDRVREFSGPDGNDSDRASRASSSSDEKSGRDDMAGKGTNFGLGKSAKK